MKKLFLFLTILAICVVTFSVTCRVFDSSFAEATIDWFAFLAGIFLIIEGLFKMLTDRDKTLTNQLLRLFRVIIGTCVFTIHLLQFMRH
jgi:predicted phage tail protein